MLRKTLSRLLVSTPAILAGGFPIWLGALDPTERVVPSMSSRMRGWFVLGYGLRDAIGSGTVTLVGVLVMVGVALWIWWSVRRVGSQDVNHTS